MVLRTLPGVIPESRVILEHCWEWCNNQNKMKSPDSAPFPQGLLVLKKKSVNKALVWAAAEQAGSLQSSNLPLASLCLPSSLHPYFHTIKASGRPHTYHWVQSPLQPSHSKSKYSPKYWAPPPATTLLYSSFSHFFIPHLSSTGPGPQNLHSSCTSYCLQTAASSPGSRITFS